MITVRPIERIGGVWRTLIIGSRKGCKSKRLFLVKAVTKGELADAVLNVINHLEHQGIHKNDI